MSTPARWRLPGGIQPPAHKTLSTQRPIQTPPLPAQLLTPLQPPQGEATIPCVQVGEHVYKGQLLGRRPTADSICAAVHAPTSGTITALTARPIGHPSGLPVLCVELSSDGADTWLPLQGVADYRQLTPQDLLARIADAGIAGMGGAGFPTASKLTSATQTRIDTVLLNAMECEPYITADDLTLRERAAQVLEGAAIVRYLLGASQLVVGIEDNKPAALAALEQALTAHAHATLVVAPARYPSGAARQTVYIVTGRETPANGHTTDVGVFCLNVGTALAIHDAIVLGRPSVSRITTLTGKALQRPGNYEVLFGTSLLHLLQTAGLPAGQTPERVIAGGPLMGYTLDHLDIPVQKTSNCFIVADRHEFPLPAVEVPCIRCGDCADVCPVRLLPQQLLWFAREHDLDKAEAYHLDDCIECGACAYVCPSHIPLVQYYRHAKGELAEERRQAALAERARLRFERHQQRLATEAREKEARRQARLAASPPAPVADTAAPVDSKAQAIAAALARSNLKKAEKRLAVAQAAGDDCSTLLEEVAALRRAVGVATPPAGTE